MSQSRSSDVPVFLIQFYVQIGDIAQGLIYLGAKILVESISVFLLLLAFNLKETEDVLSLVSIIFLLPGTTSAVRTLASAWNSH